jgi:hypothetical protein
VVDHAVIPGAPWNLSRRNNNESMRSALRSE